MREVTNCILGFNLFLITLIFGLVKVSSVSLSFKKFQDDFNTIWKQGIAPKTVGITVSFGVIMVLCFEYLDKTLKSYTWQELFGCYKIRTQVSTSENILGDERFLRYYLNSHSSVFLSMGGIYILLRSLRYSNNIQYNAPLLGLSLISMGFVSYAWWGSSLEAARDWDIFNMLLILSFLANQFISSFFHHLNIKLNSIVVLLLSIIYIKWEEYEISNKAVHFLVINALIVYISAFIVLWRIKSLGNQFLFMTSFGFILGGLFPKAADVAFGFQFGTSAFHLFEGIGFALAYEWSLTLKG